MPVLCGRRVPVNLKGNFTQQYLTNICVLRRVVGTIAKCENYAESEKAVLQTV